MSSRLEFLISTLYRPSVSRRIFAVSRAEAERLPLFSTVAVISITAPEKPEAKIEACSQILRLSFADIDHMSAAISDRAKKNLMHAFTAKQAKQILAFVAQLPAEISDVVVHCEGGYSRSAAVAVGLHKLFGFTAETERLEQANPSILHVLLEAGRSTESKPAKQGRTSRDD